MSAPWENSLATAVDRIVEAKQRGGRVIVATGSGPNIHEGVTTLIAELIHKGILDGVLTSAAVVAHEIAGTLDRVKRISAAQHPSLPLPTHILPRGGVFEITLLSPTLRASLQAHFPTGWDLYDAILALPGDTIIKAAGNMAWPMGLLSEQLAREWEPAARARNLPLETILGWGAHPMTMLGATAARNIPCLVSIPQLIGGGAVGLSLGDSIPIRERARRIAQTLASADVILESAIALSQEIHDGPFERYTGHGIWAAFEAQRACPAPPTRKEHAIAARRGRAPSCACSSEGEFTFSLENKSLIRIDLDPALELAWRKERDSSEIQSAVNRGLPKTKLTGIPFRMEMSGFARLESSLPITGDIGAVWPELARRVASRLGVTLDFLSAPQETPAGQSMRQWIVDNVTPIDAPRIRARLATTP